MTPPDARLPARMHADELELAEGEQIVLSDLINRVLDKGVVISANISISVADIHLIQLDLRLLISSVATLMTRDQRAEQRDTPSVRPGSPP